MTTLIIVTLLTLLVSATCSLFEAVLYSSRMGALEAARARGDRQAKRAARMISLKKNVASPIAAILILNTIANTAGAALAGSYAAELFGHGRVFLYSAGLTLAILMISEILPKTYGAMHWRGLWTYIVWPLELMRIVLSPLIWLSHKLSSWITRGGVPSSVSEEEILAVVALGAHEGHISEEERNLVENIIDLENQTAQDIMTPRIVMFTLPSDITAGEAAPKIAEAGFSRSPVYKEHPENIVGYVLTKDVNRARYEDASRGLSEMLKPVAFVPESANCLALLNQFLRERRHLAMVTDEYGGLAGMVTLEDLVETLLGSEIVDETDRAIDMRKIALSRGRKMNGKPRDRSGGQRPPAQ